MSRNRIPWNRYFMMQALVIGQRSAYSHTLIGSVLVKDKRVISTEYSGSVAGQKHCDDVGYQIMDGHCIRTVHSEMNTLIQRTKNGVSALDTEIYVIHFPYYNCTKALIQADVRKISYFFDYHDSLLTVELLKKTGVEINQIKLNSSYAQNLIKRITESEN